MPRHRSACGATVFTLNNLAKFFYRHLVASYLDKGTDDGPYHVAEETVGGDSKNPLLAILFPAGMGDAAIVCFDIGMELGKRGKVDIVQQMMSRLIHQFKVEIRRAFPAERVQEGVFSCYGEVLVGSAGSIKAGMSIVMNG